MHRPPPKLGSNVQDVNPQELFNVIAGAASQDPSILKASGERLKELMSMSGTIDGLSELVSRRDLPLAIRQQSVIQLKNTVASHWRSRRLLSEEARSRIKSRCLSLLDEEDDMVAKCNEAIVGKIARLDFPAQWDNLVSHLASEIERNIQARYSSPTADPRVTLRLRRSLKMLNEVLKEFTTAKLKAGVTTMANLVKNLHQPMHTYYERVSSTFTSGISSATIGLPRTADDILISHLIYKTLLKMAAWVLPRNQVNTEKEIFTELQPWFFALFQLSALRLKTLADARINLLKELYSSSTAPDALSRRGIDQLTRHIRLLGKYFRRLQELNSPVFVTLPAASDVVLYYWQKVVEATGSPPQLTSDSNEAVYPLRFLIQGMVLFKESLGQWKPFKKGVPNENTLSKEFVEEAVKLLVTRFIPLNPEDLQGWMADPEEWVNLEDTESDQWQFELRPCGERVLMTLCQQYPDYVVPLLDATFKQIIAQPTVDLAAVIQREALYCAIGRCASRLQNVIPFAEWLEHSLLPESRDPNPNFPIIKRRIAWLLGQWIGNDCAPANNAMIWDILVHLLQDGVPGSDAVVRLTAASALRQCVDSIYFDVNVFAPYLTPAVTELVGIVGSADTLESKRRITGSLSTIIERAEIRIVPLLPLLASAIPEYWTAAAEDYLFKGTLLGLVTTLVTACKEQSTSLGGLVVPLLRESFSAKSITELDEHGLKLWQEALRNAVTIESTNGVPGLIELLPVLIHLLSENLDLLGSIVNLFESYLLLGAPLILQMAPLDVFQAILKVLSGPVMPMNMKATIVALNLLIQLSLPSAWGAALHNSQLFTHIMDKLLDEETSVAETTEYLHVVARIAIADNQMFLQLMSATATLKSTPENLLWEGLMDVWWIRFDNMAEPRQRKLAAMGVASLVATCRPEVLARLPTEVFNLWMDVFCEIREIQYQYDDRSSSPIQRFWDEDEAPHSYFKGSENTFEYDRRKTVFESDPVRTQALNTWVANRYQEAVRVYGNEQAFQAAYLPADKTDPAVLRQVMDYMGLLSVA